MAVFGRDVTSDFSAGILVPRVLMCCIVTSMLQFVPATLGEWLVAVAGALAAVLMGVLLPVIIVAYSEFMNLLIARNSANSTVSENFILQIFGGGSTKYAKNYIFHSLLAISKLFRQSRVD